MTHLRTLHVTPGFVQVSVPEQMMWSRYFKDILRSSVYEFGRDGTQWRQQDDPATFTTHTSQFRFHAGLSAVMLLDGGKQLYIIEHVSCMSEMSADEMRWLAYQTYGSAEVRTAEPQACHDIHTNGAQHSQRY